MGNPDLVIIFITKIGETATVFKWPSNQMKHEVILHAIQTFTDRQKAEIQGMIAAGHQLEEGVSASDFIDIESISVYELTQ